MAKKRWVIKICKARRIPNTQQLPTAAQRRERESRKGGRCGGGTTSASETAVEEEV
jgi:hypothetical protein